MESFDIDEISLPDGFKARMKNQLVKDYDAFIESYKKPANRALLVNTLKITAKQLCALPGISDLTPVKWAENGFYYREDLRPGKLPYHDAGLYYVQEPSAMRVAEAAGALPGERVLDLCAAPGGKTAGLAASMCGSGLLVANEIHPARAKILSQNAERLGIRNCIVTNISPVGLSARFPLFFDRVVVDAPCSGEGMFRKEPEALACWSEENISLCARRQHEILENADLNLAPGGSLIYSTCTFAPEENELQIEAFLREHPDYELVLQEYIYPHENDGEGHFVARLKKGGSAVRGPQRKEKYRADKAAIKVWDAFRSEYLSKSCFLNTIDHDTPLVSFGENLYLIPEALDLSGLKVLRPGLHLGQILKGRFIPSHALALTLSPGDAAACLDLSPQDAAKYISGLALPAQGDLSGWVLITVCGKSLSWGKAANNLIKNHYPKGLRHL